MAERRNLSESMHIALLIDGDNAQPSLIEPMLEEVAKKGSITIRRIYGDWTKPGMNGWKKVLNSNAIQPRQQFMYTRGKNSTDSAMIIDAMDILHSRTVDGFCIVSSDSDYTRLATRIREDGIFVMGIGEQKTPESFVKACERFIYTENLEPETPETTKDQMEASTAKKARSKASKPKLMKLLRRAYRMAEEENETAYLGKIGETLRSIDPGFDPRSYGSRTLTQLFRSLPEHFEIFSQDKGSSVYIRMKSAD